MRSRELFSTFLEFLGKDYFKKLSSNVTSLVEDGCSHDEVGEYLMLDILSTFSLKLKEYGLDEDDVIEAFDYIRMIKIARKQLEITAEIARKQREEAFNEIEGGNNAVHRRRI